MGLSRELLRERARICEHSDRFEDMKTDMTTIANMGTGLDIEERNLLSVAFKNVVGERRSSWRILGAVEDRAKSDSERKAALTAKYKARVEEEMEQYCGELLTLLDDKLIPVAKEASEKVFLLKMKGDYNRYLSEIYSKNSANRNKTAQAAEDAYQSAMDVATSELKAYDPIRLGLVLNFSVFYYEIVSSSEKACDMAQEALTKGIETMEQCENDTYADTTAILQLLKDNLDTWRSDASGAGGDDK